MFAQLQYVAHRGASYYAPENSLGSIKLAWELGCDGAECDIQFTKDRQVMLSHDANTGRMTDQKLVISDTNYSDLRKLNLKLSATNSTWFEGEKMPLLKDVLTTIPKDKVLVIEIKCSNEVFPELQKVIKKYWKTGKIAFISFSFETISQAKVLFPAVPCYYLSSLKDDIIKRIPEIKKAKLDGVDANYKAIDQQLVEELKNAKLELWCWTVDTKEETIRMHDLGVTVITTNRPTWLKEQLMGVK
jgi:glycerophosphoryl diester phosphodiesterase